MRTLILYATKHGTTREIAGRIAGHIEGAVVHDLKEKDIPPLSGFDCVIIGSPIYSVSIRREAKAFLAKHAAQLREKQLGFLLSGMDASRQEKYFSDNFPRDILQTAKATRFLGGIFDPKESSFRERLTMNLLAGQVWYVNTVNDAAIKNFADFMKA